MINCTSAALRVFGPGGALPYQRRLNRVARLSRGARLGLAGRQGRGARLRRGARRAARDERDHVHPAGQGYRNPQCDLIDSRSGRLADGHLIYYPVADSNLHIRGEAQSCCEQSQRIRRPGAPELIIRGLPLEFTML